MPPVELPDAKGVGPAYATEPPPPLGERNRKLIEDGCRLERSGYWMFGAASSVTSSC